MHAKSLGIQRKIEVRSLHSVGLAIMAVAAVITGFLLLLNSDLSNSFPYFFLLPWIALLFIVLIAPSFFLYRQGNFSFANPIIFSTWTYFIPGFVIGGISLATGWSHPYFLSLIQDPQNDLPWAIGLVIIGFIGLSVGYMVPFGAVVGRALGTHLGRYLEDRPVSLTGPAFCLLGLGMLSSATAIILGVFGYQQQRQIESYEGLVFLSSLFLMEATFLLWSIVFRHRKFTTDTYVLVAVLLVIGLGGATFSGSRASFLGSLILIVLAFILSGRTVSTRKTLMIGLSLCAALVIGMIYGTSFRQVSVESQGSGFEAYLNNAVETFERIGRTNSTDNLEFGLNLIAERLDAVSSLAVVVSNYEQLAPYEEGYGLDNNINRDLATTFIPRVIWNDKPVASNPRLYGELYFNYGENSFAMTAFGDLLRNYGVIGVPLGMFFIGLLMRITYRALIEGQRPAVLRTTLYFMLLTSINYEGFYGITLANFVKIGLTSVVGILLVIVFAKFVGRATNEPTPSGV